MTLSQTLRFALLASAGSLALVACGGGGSSNTGTTGSVTVNIGGGGGGGGNNKIDLVPGSCPTGTTLTTTRIDNVDIDNCQISAGNITADLTLTANTGFGISGSVFVGDNLITTPSGRSAKLTIEPGVILFGINGEDALVVNPGSQIEAIGTVAAPIVMTSGSDVADGDVNDGASNGNAEARAEWGGLVINGFAPINDCDDTTATPGTAACNKTGEGGSGLFGGDNPNDNSGTLRYVRIQYAGFNFNDEDQLNGIAFQGVGDGTTVDHIQVHNNQDDGIEFFGGNVDVKYVVVTGAGDDSIDWTDGWDGSVQYALVIQSDTIGDRGFEGDNRSNDTDILPRSMPTISNFTFFGGQTGSDGAKLRAGTAGSLGNGIILGFPNGDSFDFDQNSTLGVVPSLFSTFVSGATRAFDSEASPIFNASGSMNVASAGDTMDGLFPGVSEKSVTPTDLSGTDGKIENVAFIGAFDPVGENASSNWASDWTLSGSFPTSVDQGCPTGTTQSSQAIPAGYTGTETRICTLPSVIASNLTLTRGNNLYKVSGAVFVGQDLGADANNPLETGQAATLTIEPGVTIFGESGNDALFVTRGSKISANGTAAAPITMTSFNDISGLSGATSRGEWGGLVLSGRAGINDCDVVTVDPVANPELCEKTGEGGSGLFGGNLDTDDSGNLNYVVVKFAGFNFNDEDQLNGIAFQGVGSGTEVDFIQVHNNQDDGVEFFGGTVNVKHVVLTGNADDMFDWTDGWRGKAQFVIAVQADDIGDNVIEADNRSNDTDIAPVSNPTLSNLTLVGGATNGNVIRVRAGTDGDIFNTIVTGGNDGIEFNDQGSARPTFFSTYVVDNVRSLNTVPAGMFDAANGNVDGEAATPAQDSTLSASGTTAALVPGANELAVAPTATGDSFFEDTTYIGAVSGASDSWYKGWTFGL